MAQYGDRARESLLDAAEELFALHGIDAVSNRKITEHAGTANHSAIKYHFGGRDDMIAALLARGRDEVAARRAAIVDMLPDEPSLHDTIGAGVLPWVGYLESLPVPSWHARFYYQAMSLPSAEDSMRETIENSVLFDPGITRVPELADVPESVLVPRIRILAGLTLRLCAGYEADLEAGTAEGDWTSIGYFIVDAATGMLAAPVTRR
ncbi:TetR/AcrR family transcriptional regulator [Gordonia liuliyuniae]|uniref:TetR/AcrR family transcriptional regulator n=1 Tax=Gordonia liuliyuniae TaxID=2911517 RepID=A0ABS9IXJ2_9ACTN|nr:TetR family transcriptional regulator [Gordonia liuliyuniae]MCF8590283.1 TetR/AcrR family transcriptional regulator [Gordonia liuliyuniae]